MSLSQWGMEIYRSFDTQSCDRRELIVDQLTLDDVDRPAALAKGFLEAEHVGPPVIVVLEELPHVIELILVPNFTVYLDTAPRKGPAEKRRGELVVETYAVSRRVFTLEKTILQRPGPEARTRLIPSKWNVEETRAAYLQPGNSARHDDNQRRRHQTARTWPILVDVSLWTCDTG